MPDTSWAELAMAELAGLAEHIAEGKQRAPAELAGQPLIVMDTDVVTETLVDEGELGEFQGLHGTSDMGDMLTVQPGLGDCISAFAELVKQSTRAAACDADVTHAAEAELAQHEHTHDVQDTFIELEDSQPPASGDLQGGSAVDHAGQPEEAPGDVSDVDGGPHVDGSGPDVPPELPAVGCNGCKVNMVVLRNNFIKAFKAEYEGSHVGAELHHEACSAWKTSAERQAAIAAYPSPERRRRRF